MSVKFEKETIRNAPIPGDRKHDIAHAIGEKLTGGAGGAKTGYLAVSGNVIPEYISERNTSLKDKNGNSSILINFPRILYAPRCSLQAPWLHFKKFLHHGSQRMLGNGDIISAPEYQRWQLMEL